MVFVSQHNDTKNIITILDGRTQTVIWNHFLRHQRKVGAKVKCITMDMFSPYYDLAKRLFPNAQIVLDRFHIIQHLNRAMDQTGLEFVLCTHLTEHLYNKRFWVNYWIFLKNSSITMNFISSSYITSNRRIVTFFLYWRTY